MTKYWYKKLNRYDTTFAVCEKPVDNAWAPSENVCEKQESTP
jgi:hypothetical protein